MGRLLEGENIVRVENVIFGVFPGSKPYSNDHARSEIEAKRPEIIVLSRWAKISYAIKNFFPINRLGLHNKD